MLLLQKELHKIIVNAMGAKSNLVITPITEQIIVTAVKKFIFFDDKFDEVISIKDKNITRARKARKPTSIPLNDQNTKGYKNVIELAPAEESIRQ